MRQHVGADVVEQYVMGALDAESSRFLETHVAQCAPCAAMLQSEAALEVALHEVAAVNVVSLSARRRRMGAFVASAAFAAAAALLVFSLGRVPAGDEHPVLRECLEASTAQQCISQAQFDGVITIGPDREPIVPRYDVGSPEGAAP